MVSAVSKIIWGHWETPKIEISCIDLGRVEWPDLLDEPSFLDLKERLYWHKKKDCTLDDMLRFFCGAAIQSSEKWIKLFQGSIFATAMGLVGFEAVAWKYSDAFISPYFKIVPRIILAAGLALAFCRWWGAYSHKKAIEQQIITVAEERHKFYKKGMRGLDSTSQVLHYVEGVCWAGHWDKEFKQWIESLKPREMDASERGSQIRQFLNSPPFKSPESISAKVLNRCIAPSPILESYDKFSALLKTKWNDCLFSIEQYERDIEAKVRLLVPEIQQEKDELCRVMDPSEKISYIHYCDLAYAHLIPEKCKEAIAKSAETKGRIEGLLDSKIELWKANLASYQKGETSTIALPNLDDVSVDLPPFATENPAFFTTYKEFMTWRNLVLEENPQKGTKEEYLKFIDKISQKLMQRI